MLQKHYKYLFQNTSFAISKDLIITTHQVTNNYINAKFFPFNVDLMHITKIFTITYQQARVCGQPLDLPK